MSSPKTTILTIEEHPDHYNVAQEHVRKTYEVSISCSEEVEHLFDIVDDSLGKLIGPNSIREISAYDISRVKREFISYFEEHGFEFILATTCPRNINSDGVLELNTDLYFREPH